METVPSPEEIIDLTGAEGETLFWHIKSWLILGYEGDLQKRVDNLWDHYKDVEDQRLLALVGALCVETTLDALLSGFILDFDSLKEESDVTFSLKTRLARAMCLIPRKILNSCDLIRRIRNDFAHNLKIETFAQLPPRHLNKLEPYVQQYNSKERDAKDWTSLYRNLVGFTALALTAYSYQVEAVSDYLQTTDFRKNLKNHVENA